MLSLSMRYSLTGRPESYSLV